MPFLPGNTLWKLAKNPGRPTKFKDSQELWEKCLEYFKWVEENPLYEAKLVSYKGLSAIENVPKMRAMTNSGLFVFLGIDQSTWTVWKSSEENEFFAVAMAVEEVMKEQKLTGASADLLNANIIARDLKLKDSSDVTHNAGEGVSFNLSFGAKDGN